jgi:hypothetical protein
MTNGNRIVGASPQESDEEHRITARTVRTADGTVATEYRVDGRVAGSAAEVEALLEGSA